MRTPNDPLEYLPYYPPTDKWEKLFIGVRWLGPDLSFFKILKQQQSKRTSACMKTWENTEREEIACALGLIFRECLFWPTPYFIPGDRFEVIAGGPSIGWMDNDDLEEAIEKIEKYIGIRLPDHFWLSSTSKTFGEIIDELITIKHKNT